MPGDRVLHLAGWSCLGCSGERCCGKGKGLSPAQKLLSRLGILGLYSRILLLPKPMPAPWHPLPVLFLHATPLVPVSFSPFHGFQSQGFGKALTRTCLFLQVTLPPVDPWEGRAGRDRLPRHGGQLLSSQRFLGPPLQLGLGENERDPRGHRGDTHPSPLSTGTPSQGPTKNRAQAQECLGGQPNRWAEGMKGWVEWGTGP